MDDKKQLQSILSNMSQENQIEFLEHIFGWEIKKVIEVEVKDWDWKVTTTKTEYVKINSWDIWSF